MIAKEAIVKNAVRRDGEYTLENVEEARFHYRKEAKKKLSE